MPEPLFLLTGHGSQGLTEALFSTLENYSLLDFKVMLMRTLGAPRIQLCKTEFSIAHSWALLVYSEAPCLSASQVSLWGLHHFSGRVLLECSSHPEHQQEFLSLIPLLFPGKAGRPSLPLCNVKTINSCTFSLMQTSALTPLYGSFLSPAFLSPCA